MRNSFKKIATILCFATLSFSCSDFLDITPPNGFESEDVYGSTKSLEGYVTQRYAELKDGYYRQALRFACDEAWNNFNWDGTNGMHRGQMTPDFNGNLGTWKDYYYAIKNCNIYMANMERIDKLRVNEKESQTVDQLTGEIRFLRAFFYADLISRYGGVPIITRLFELDTPKDEMFVARDSYEACVKFVVEELDAASAALPVTYTSTKLGRATKGAALALKSRVLLYAASKYWNPQNDIRKWEAARDAAADLINLNMDGSIDPNSGLKVYSLDPEYIGPFQNHQSKEIIFMKLFSTDFGHYFDWYNSPNGYMGYSETCVSEGLVDAYEMADGSMPDPLVLYGEKGKEYEPGTSPWDGREPRFYASIACDGQLFRGRDIECYVNAAGNGGGKDSRQGGIEEWNASATGFFVRKFMKESLEVAWNDKSNQPWIYMRLGEIYLNYAEALYMTGDESGARTYIEKIRARARGGNNVLPEVTSSGDELMKKIQQERRIELAFEEHRFFDVRRWRIADVTEIGKLNGVLITKSPKGKKTYKLNTVEQKREFFEQHYLFPIPRNEMERNGKFVQNPGYN